MKKLIVFVVAAMLMFSAAIGGTYAYLTDHTQIDNVITVGSIEVVQIERQRNDSGELEPFENGKTFIPGIYLGYDENELPMDGEYYDSTIVSNAIDKIITVKNIGKNDAYVRTLIAFEQGTISGDEFDSFMLMNRNEVNWTWSLIGNDIIINDDGVDKKYTVYCAVYNSVLEPEAETESSLRQLLLSGKYGEDDSIMLDPENDGEYVISVMTQAVQTEGFTDASTALDTTFGPITATNNPWTE